MTYQGYKSREEVYKMVKDSFPFQSKPEGNRLTNQGAEDCICRYIVEHMERYSEAEIPMDGIRYLHSELPNLSARGMNWLLPNLLRKAVICTNRFDTITDTIIYDLELAAEGEKQARSRYSWLSAVQRQCLESTLEYLSEVHGHAISKAISALSPTNA
ncbi:hypothetical protein QT397_13085 [Microbulbifer sp. MKSA007]|nr:hypothetical protein QT397_13085 [Microbulbifer sp. MKSA007]